MITKNAARCLRCHEVLESNSRHDFVECSCGNVFVDGGHAYVRHGVRDLDFYENLSESDQDEGLGMS